MLIRNIGAPRFVASAGYDTHTEDVVTGEVIEVSDEFGVVACAQVDVWEPADADSKKKVEAAEKKAERERKQAEKGQDAAPAVADDDNKDGK